jgi:hypothetical protein
MEEEERQPSTSARIFASAKYPQPREAPPARSRVYITDDFFSENFHVEFAEDIRYETIPRERLPLPASDLLKFDDTNIRVVDLGYNLQHMGAVCEFLDTPDKLLEFRHSVVELLGRFGEQRIHLHLVQPDQNGISIRENKVLIGDHHERQVKEEKLGRLYQKILDDLSSFKFTSLRQVALHNRTTVYKVRKVWKEYLYVRQLPRTYVLRPRIILPPAREAYEFFRDRYMLNGEIAPSWNDLAIEFEHTFNIPYNEDRPFTTKAIINKMRKTYKLKSLKIRGRKSQEPPFVFLIRQLCVCRCLVSLLHQDTDLVVFFDQTSVDPSCRPRTAIGTREMVPLAANTVPWGPVYLLAAVTKEGRGVFQFSREHATEMTTIPFLHHAVAYFESIFPGRPISIVLDNGPYQKTAAVRRSMQQLGVTLFYNVPRSPFCNLIEDFFLHIKQTFRYVAAATQQDALNILVDNIREFYNGSSFDWIVRKFLWLTYTKINMTLERDLDIASIIRDLNNIEPTGTSLKKRDPSSRIGAAGISRKVVANGKNRPSSFLPNSDYNRLNANQERP